jgi:hypothetical protein
LWNAVLYVTAAKKKTDEKIIYFVDSKDDRLDNNNFKFVKKDYIIALLPNCFSDMFDKILLNLAKKLEYPGQTLFRFLENIKNHSHLLFDYCASFLKGFFDYQSSGNILNLMCDSGYIKLDEAGSLSLTLKGWLRVDKLQRKYQVLPQAFVAMWFDCKMKGFKEVILKAIEDLGYQAVIISDKEHNNQIIPEIFYEIKRSQFVVADITGQRNGVYYEAGYAEALGKEVIITCQKEDQENIHFDIAQKKMILYTDENDLMEQLKRRIEVTVGKNISLK